MDFPALATHGAWGFWLGVALVFLAMLLEALPALGLLVPGQTVVVAVAFFAAQRGWPFWWLLGAAFLGGAAGDFVSYSIGRRYGTPWLMRLPRRLRPGPERMEQISRIMERRGATVVFMGRFQPLARSFGPFFAGVAQMPVVAFSLANLASSAAMSALLVGAGLLAGFGFVHATTFLGLALLSGFLAAVAILGAYWLVTRKLAIVRRDTLTAVILAAAGIPSLLELAREIGRRHFFVIWEEKAWQALAPEIEHGLHETMWGIAWAGNLYVVAGAGLLLFVVLAALRRWRDAYMSLATGPVTAGLALLAKALVPREPPLQYAPFVPFGSFPSEGAALLPPLVGLVTWILLRDRPRNVIVQTVLAFLAMSVLTVSVAPFIAGMAWPTDIIGGWLLGGSIFGLAFVTRRIVDTLTHPTPPPRTTIVLDAWRRWRERPGVQRIGRSLHRHLFERTTALWLLVAFGAAASVMSYWTHPLGIDANRYAVMGESFRETGSFVMPWGDVYSPGSGPQYSHHYPPLYPMVLSVFFRVFGFSPSTVHLAAIFLAGFAFAVTYACSRDLYGHRKALVATVVVAIAPAIVQNTAKAYSESLVLALFVATMWAILKSLEKPAYIVAAGALAALSYLTKSSMGYFFIIAGLGGLAWRLAWRGRTVLRDRNYLAAIAIFGATVAVWGWRNWKLFGSWETSSHLTQAYVFAFHEPLTWFLRSILTFGFMLVMGYFLFLGLLPWLPRLLRFPKFTTEHDSGLWLAVGLPLILTAVIDAALWMYEGAFFFDNVRYLSFVIVPAAWLIMRNAPWDRASKAAAVLSVAILLGISIGIAAVPGSPTPVAASRELGTLVHDGDSVTFVGTGDVYRFYFDATDNGARRLDVRVRDAAGAAADQPDWIVAKGAVDFSSQGYQQVAAFQRGANPSSEPMSIWRPSSA